MKNKDKYKNITKEVHYANGLIIVSIFSDLKQVGGFTTVLKQDVEEEFSKWLESESKDEKEK